MSFQENFVVWLLANYSNRPTFHPQMKRKMKTQTKSILKTQTGMLSWLQLQSYCLLMQFQRFVLHFLPVIGSHATVFQIVCWRLPSMHQTWFTLNSVFYWQINEICSNLFSLQDYLGPEIVSHYVSHGASTTEIIKHLITALKKNANSDMAALFFQALRRVLTLVYLWMHMIYLQIYKWWYLYGVLSVRTSCNLYSIISLYHIVKEIIINNCIRKLFWSCITEDAISDWNLTDCKPGTQGDLLMLRVGKWFAIVIVSVYTCFIFAMLSRNISKYVHCLDVCAYRNEREMLLFL